MRVMPGAFDSWLQISEAIEVRRLARFVIASVLLEVRALEGSEIDGHDGQPWAENRVRLESCRGVSLKLLEQCAAVIWNR